MRAAVVTFPGSNCDRDLAVALEQQLERPVARVWHGHSELPDVDLVGVPGGFSFGDYLRCGAMSARSPIMDAVRRHAARGGFVLGICNGFQILTEAGLLPGALIRNAGLKFVCRAVELEVANANSPFTRAYASQRRISLPVAHHDGNFVLSESDIERLEGEGRVVFRYAEEVNGSRGRIAGLLNERRNVLGMMPHPERACDPMLGGTDGALLFQSLLAAA